MIRIILYTFLVFFLSACQQKEKNDNATNSSEITLEEKIGQMVMVGFRDTIVTKDTEIYSLIKDYHIGGVVLYNRDVPSKDSIKRNIISKEQLRSLNSSLQSITDHKLIIAIDEEGGLVSRLKTKNGFQSHLSHLEIGNINQKDTTRLWANTMAKELKDLGINMNFGPVVDLNINPDCPVIGKIKRSFSADPNVVYTHAKIFIEEHKKKGIVCVPKHFPGHGSAKMDSHLGFTDVSETWTEKELLPYQSLINNKECDIVMTAHVYNEKLDTLPSTLSKKIIDKYLKEKLNFEGVIISDDMQMGAITLQYGFEESIEKAIDSGVDIILLSNNSYQVPYDPEIAIKTIDVIKNMVKTNKINEKRINDSYQKIIQLKKMMDN